MVNVLVVGKEITMPKIEHHLFIQNTLKITIKLDFYLKTLLLYATFDKFFNTKLCFLFRESIQLMINVYDPIPVLHRIIAWHRNSLFRLAA